MVVFSHHSLFMATIFALVQVFQGGWAYDSDNRLVDYNDLITITKSTDPDTEVLTLELFAFPYIQDVSPSSPSSLPCLPDKRVRPLTTVAWTYLPYCCHVVLIKQDERG